MTRAAVDQVVQLGRELTSGTRIAATRRLPGLSINILPQANQRQFRGKGNNVTTSAVIDRLFSNGTYDGFLDYNAIVYVLASMIGVDDGYTPDRIGATDGYEWEFNPVSAGPDLFPVTYTAEEGDSEAAMITDHLRFLSLNVDWSNDGANINGNLIGRFPDDGETLTTLTDEQQLITKSGTVTGGTFTITYDGQTTSAIAYNATNAVVLTALEALSNLAPGDVVLYGGPVNTAPLRIVFQGTLKGTNVAAVTVDSGSLTGGGTYVPSTDLAGGASLTEIDQRPVSRNQVDLYIDDSYASIGTTKITAAYAGNFTVGDKAGPFWALNTDFDSFVDLVHIAADVGGSFSTAHNSQSRSLYQNISGNATKYLRIIAQGENIGVSADEQIRLDAAIRLGQPEKDQDVNGVFGFKFNFASIHDADLGGAYKFYVVNRLTQL